MTETENSENSANQAEKPKYWKVVWFLHMTDRFKKGSKDGREEREGFSREDAERRCAFLKKNHNDRYIYDFRIEPDDLYARDFLSSRAT